MWYSHTSSFDKQSKHNWERKWELVFDLSHKTILICIWGFPPPFNHKNKQRTGCCWPLAITSSVISHTLTGTEKLDKCQKIYMKIQNQSWKECNEKRCDYSKWWPQLHLCFATQGHVDRKSTRWWFCEGTWISAMLGWLPISITPSRERKKRGVEMRGYGGRLAWRECGPIECRGYGIATVCTYFLVQLIYHQLIKKIM